MISLFFKGETDFNNNGIVLIDCIKDSVKITEDLEGVFDLELDYPIQDRKNISQYLVQGNILRSPIYDDRPDQLFRIRKVSINSSNSIVSVYCQALACCDLMADFVFGGGNAPLIPAGKTRKEAIALVLAAAQDNSNKFHVGNLDTSTNTSVNLGLDDNGNVINYVDVAYVSPLTGLLNNSDGVRSIYNAYGGEIIFNNFTIDMVDERGKVDDPFIIKSGKNLQELQQDIDDISDDFATVLVMKSSDGIYLPNNEVIISPNVNVLGRKWKVITCEDVAAANDTPEALNVVYDQLRERGQKKFTKDGIDAITVSNTVKFAQLTKTEQYKDYNILEKCELGNNVTIVYSKLNDLTVNARITRIIYNPLALNGEGKIIEVTIGNRKKTNIALMVNSTKTIANTANVKSIENKVEIKKVKKSSKDFQVTMEARADSIELSVTNETNNRISAINVLDGQIESKVSKGDFGSYIEQNYDSVTQAIIDATGTHKSTFDSTGLTIENGGFKIKNSNGTTVLWMGDDGYVKVKDLDFDNTAFASGSYFWQALYNTKNIVFQYPISAPINTNMLKVENQSGLMIGNDTIHSYVVQILQDYNLI